jgi:hypothetical protein
MRLITEPSAVSLKLVLFKSEIRRDDFGFPARSRW